MPAVLSLVTMFLVKPAETRRSGSLLVGAGVGERLEGGILTELGIFGVPGREGTLAQEETRFT